MLNLSATTDKLSLITSSGADIDARCDYTEVANPALTTSSVIVDKKNTTITTATTTDVSGSPAASSTRNIKALSFRNIDGATSNDLTLQFDQNGTLFTILKCTLLAGETLLYREGYFFHYDTNGGVYSVGQTFALQADQESGTSLTLVVNPGVQHFHPCSTKCWGEFTANSTTILASYNITSLADTATGAMTVTIANDFSSANWACFVTRSEDDLTLVYSATYDAKTAGTVILRSAVEAGSGSDPTSASGNASWSFQGMGDL
jgi:hypothetical protein